MSLAAETVGGGLDSATSKREPISELEGCYIKLLETKIARLQCQVAACTNEGTSQDNKANAREESDSEIISQSEDSMKLKNRFRPETDESLDEASDPRYPILLSKWDFKRGEFVDKPTSVKEDKKKFGPQPEPREAFIFRKISPSRATRVYRRRRFRRSSSLDGSNVDILFPPLQKMIGKITSKWGGPDVVTKYSFPFPELIYSWTEAFDEANKPVYEESKDEQRARRDLKELLKIISTSSGDERLDRYFKERDIFLREKSITHEALWTLFPPGALILARPCLGEPQIFSVHSSDKFVPNQEEFNVICYSFDWNGYEFNRVPFEMTIDWWGDDKKNIVELPFYPLEFYKDPQLDHEDAVQRLRNKLIERGKKYRNFCIAERGKQMFNYEGHAYFQKDTTILGYEWGSPGEVHNRVDDTASSMSGSASQNASSGSGGAREKQVSGAVMVDFASYFNYQSAKVPILGPLRRQEEQIQEGSPERRPDALFQKIYKSNWDRHAPTKAMTNEQYLICPPRVLGYALKMKKWGQFLVKDLRPPDEADVSTFQDKLQLDKDSKELIRKSIIAHEKGKLKANGRANRLEDFTPEKGRGLVILLYGFPGVGKTLTAESAAQMAGKPLFSVGVSDIGTEGDRVEMNLQKVFDLAGNWGAILLFDDADVFLEARGKGQNDLRRNAIVSVFLRVLEYYSGILILTTNRMRSFDTAVLSRIHLAIKYGDLTQGQRQSIFYSFLEQLHEKKLIENLDDVKKWVHQDGKQYDFNGRQIRNVVSTALGIALAEDNGKLSREHLGCVARQTEEFNF